MSSRDGKILVFISAKQAVNSGAHNATDSLHKINWPSDWDMDKQVNVTEVVCPTVCLDLLMLCSAAYSPFQLFQVPIVMCPEDGCFPGLYCSSILSNPWLSDGCTMILSSAWRSTEVILSIDVLR